MKILNLNLKAQWYIMIEDGKKLEEYREIKPYWTKRLLRCKEDGHFSHCEHNCSQCGLLPFIKCKKYTHVRLNYGYTSRYVFHEIKAMTIDYGRVEWGAPKDKRVIVIILGKRIK